MEKMTEKRGDTGIQQKMNIVLKQLPRIWSQLTRTGAITAVKREEEGETSDRVVQLSTDFAASAPAPSPLCIWLLVRVRIPHYFHSTASDSEY